MARIKGIAPFSGNFEPQIAAPLDARSVVEFIADLLLPATWEALDGLPYVYVGMPVVVIDDPTPANNGLYYLADLDYTNPANWVKVGTGSGGSVVTGHTITGDGTALLPLDVNANITRDWTASTDMSTDEVVTDASGNLYRATLDFTTDATDIANDILAGNLVAIGAAGSLTYTGTAERTVGGITDGMVFTGATIQEMWDQLIRQEKFPVLTPPSMTFTASITGFREVGEVIDIDFNATFNRGSIVPQYTAATPYRSGDPNLYDYTGTGLVDNPTSALSDAQSVLGYTVLINGQSWVCSVAHDAGPQPKSSYDNDYLSPLPAGSVGPVTRTITGVYPIFGTTVNISTLTKQALVAMNSAYFQVDVVAESLGLKQRVDIPQAWSAITGIQFYNTVSSAWEWIGGSKANSLTTFTVTASTETIQGNVINYNLWTHNGSTIGARQLRFYTT